MHGEADFVASFNPTRVLDAGCGTGRVAIELASRGIEVVGVDLDPSMLKQARTKAPGLPWVLGDLSRLALDASFDVVVAAGNVMIFLAHGTELEVVSNLAAPLVAGGRLVAGFSTDRHVSASDYSDWAFKAHLTEEARYSTWDAEPWTEQSCYGVFVHRRGS